MANLHYNYSSAQIRKAIEGKHDLATKANVDKLMRLDLAKALPSRVADAVHANFEHTRSNCVGDADWQAVIDAPDVMQTAENLVMLFDGGYKAQAQRNAENQSVWIGNDFKKEVTVFGFADGSAVYTSGPEFRTATEAEIEEYK